MIIIRRPKYTSDYPCPASPEKEDPSATAATSALQSSPSHGSVNRSPHNLWPAPQHSRYIYVLAAAFLLPSATVIHIFRNLYVIYCQTTKIW